MTTQPTHPEAVYPVAETSRRIRDLPSTLQPRELFARLGAQNVEDEVLLALLLRTGLPRLNVRDLARRLIETYRTLTALSQAREQELERIPGIGPVKAQMLKAAFELARRLADEKLGETVTIRGPEDVVAALRADAQALTEESFWILPLSPRNRLLSRRPERISSGIRDACLVHPREVFGRAILHKATAVVVAHNHPSSDPTPSPDDLKITRQLIEVGRTHGIRVLDHVVLGIGGDREYLSLREAGLAAFDD